MEHETITISQQNNVYFVRLNEIIFCQSDSCYTSIILSDGRKILVAKSLSKFHEELSSEIFIRVNQSFVININFVKTIKKKAHNIELYNNHVVPYTVPLKKLLLLIAQVNHKDSVGV